MLSNLNKSDTVTMKRTFRFEIELRSIFESGDERFETKLETYTVMKFIN